EETLWPIETGHVDKLVVMHGLETSERPGDLLNECWRVLGPGGKAIFIVPNRAGLWSRSDKTPFGFGRPYTLSQLETQLKTHHFIPERHCSALYQPPSFRRFWLKSGSLIERTATRLPTIMAGGVFIVAASKRVQPPQGSATRDPEKRPLKALDGLLKPA
ncbi:MAG: class I SAM-dependent methyltransferase, partial [Pseudomonadota bacterium]